MVTCWLRPFMKTRALTGGGMIKSLLYSISHIACYGNSSPVYGVSKSTRRLAEVFVEVRSRAYAPGHNSPVLKSADGCDGISTSFEFVSGSRLFHPKCSAPRALTESPGPRLWLSRW